MILRLLIAPALLHTALCAQPSAPSPVPAPLRELPWGQLNFLHTTDIHGWWGGHLQEPSYSADWGDYISFAHHLHERADADGSDLLLIDTGDRIEGNAIYDSSKPRGKFTYEIAKEAPINLISSGNHELYKQESSEGEFYHTVPDFSGRYLATNLDIYNPETGVLEPLAPRFKKFTTKNQGIRILAFGFIFDFTGNANNTVVIPVEQTVLQPWFKEAILDANLDLIIVFGHVDIRSKEYAAVHQRIRSFRPTLPIQFFGGHTHIRDYTIYDDYATALESGRYMETIGFQSITGLRTPSSPQAPSLTFARRYIDKNLYSLHHHSNKTADTFPTPHGVDVSQQIDSARKSLDLNRIYGCAPQNYWVNRRPYPHRESIYTWLEKQVLPDIISSSRRSQRGKKSLVILNTGGIRFDIFKGAYTKDTTYLVSPFTSGLRYIKEVKYGAASQVIKLLNNEGPILEAMRKEGKFAAPPEMLAAEFRPGMFAVQAESDAGVHGHAYDREQQQPLTSRPHLTPGYTTIDDLGTDGDDTLHTPISFYFVPNCIQASVNLPPNILSSSNPNFSPDDDDDDEVHHVDLIYNEFIERWILLALQYLGEKKSTADTKRYFEDERKTSSFTELMTEWVREKWGEGIVDGVGVCEM